MIICLWTELRKLKGTLVVTLCLTAPALVIALMTLICARNGPMPWTVATMNAIPIWAFFILPMTLAALSALLAQIEHGPRMWDHLLALPVNRWKIYTAKGLIIIILTGLMSLVMIVGLWLAGLGLGLLLPGKAMAGHFPWGHSLRIVAMIWGASLFMAMIQLWVALRFRSFVAPLTVGLGGTFCALSVMSAKEALYVPWVMPIKVLMNNGAEANTAVQLSLTGGLIVFIAMIWHLSRKEA